MGIRSHMGSVQLRSTVAEVPARKIPERLIYFDHLARMPDPPAAQQQLRSLLEDPEALSAEILKQVLASMHRVNECLLGRLTRKVPYELG